MIGTIGESAYASCGSLTKSFSSCCEILLITSGTTFRGLPDDDGFQQALVAAAEGLPAGFAVALEEAAEASDGEQGLADGRRLVELEAARDGSQDLKLEATQQGRRRHVWCGPLDRRLTGDWLGLPDADDVDVARRLGGVLPIAADLESDLTRANGEVYLAAVAGRVRSLGPVLALVVGAIRDPGVTRRDGSDDLDRIGEIGVVLVDDLALALAKADHERPLSSEECVDQEVCIGLAIHDVDDVLPLAQVRHRTFNAPRPACRFPVRGISLPRRCGGLADARVRLHIEHAERQSIVRERERCVCGEAGAVVGDRADPLALAFAAEADRRRVVRAAHRSCGRCHPPSRRGVVRRQQRP